VATLEAPDGSLLEVADDRAAAYEAKGYKRTASFGGESLVTSKATGQVVQGDAAALPTFREATNEDVANYEAQREFGGEKGRAFFEGLGRTATLGLSDIAAQALGADERGLRERRERTGGVSMAGEIGGALLPWGAASIAGKAGGAVTKALTREGAGLAGRVGARAAGTAAEGSLFGFGQGVSELALSEEPVTAERAFKVLGSNTVLGGAIGGGFGGAGALLGEAAKAGKAALAERMARFGGGKADDAALASEGRSIAEGFRAEQKASKDWFNAVDDTGQRKVLANSTGRIRKLGDQVEHIAEDPRRALGPLRERVQKLEEVAAGADDLRAAVEVERRAVAAELPSAATAPVKLNEKQTLLYRAWSGDKIKGKTVKIEPQRLDEFRAALDNGEVASARLKGLDAAEAQLAADRSVIERIKAWDESSKAAKEAAKAKPIGTQTVEGLASGAVGMLATALGAPGMLAFPLAAKAGEMAGQVFSGRVKQILGKLSDQAAASQQSISKALDVFVSSGARVSKAAAIKTSTSLAGARYAPPSLVEASAVGQRPSGRSRGSDVDNYRARERELLAMTTRGPDGKIMMRPAGANHVFEALAPIRMVAPKAADNLAAQAQRRVEFLANKLPPRPDRTGLQFGEDDWQPSDMELRKFARYVDAVEGGPEVIAERVSSGQLTPEDAETLREVYPETYREIQAGLIDRLSTVRRMPYSKRLMLGVLFDVATDDSLNPEFIAGMQSRFPAEEGTEGGMQAPSSKLGSVTNPAPTAAQRLST
jgi:hypothetical protein